MATVDKNFRIKHGLVVEGTTGTINGNTILTESSGDSYILNLVGGATLVKSVDTYAFNVDSQGYLTFNISDVIDGYLGFGNELSYSGGTISINRSVVDNWYDAAGAASTAQTNAASYTDSAITSALNTFGNQTSSDIADAIQTAEDYADSLAVNYDSAGSAYSAEQNAKSYADSLATNYDPAGSASTAQGNAEDYAEQVAQTAETNAKSYADSLATNYDASGAAATAEQNAKNYADGLAGNYDAAGAAEQALLDANDYTDTAVANVVGLAPAALDTLQELAQAFSNSPDTLTNLITEVGTKQDALTAGEGIYIDGSNNITARHYSGGGLKFVFNEAAIDRSTVDGWYDASGAAATAEQNAKDYADSLSSNYDEAGSADQALTDANSYTDTAVGNIQSAVSQISGSVISPNAVNINDVANQYATLTEGIMIADGATTVMGLSSSTYRTVKALVKATNGTHSQVSEILLTLDNANNVAITEYAMVGTNGSLGEVTAIHHASGNIFILFTPAYNNTDVMVYTTALI
jgi:hypothetical protein